VKRLNRWLDQHPWAWAVLLVVVNAGVLLAIRPSRSPIGALLSSVLYAAFALWAYRRRRRRDLRAAGSQDADIRGLGRMIAKGQVPEDAGQRDQMRGLMVRRRRQIKRARWLMPLFSAMVLVIAGLGIASHSWAAALPLLALVVLFDSMAVLGYRKQKRNLRRLDERLS
jgi:hypothetical protein